MSRSSCAAWMAVVCLAGGNELIAQVAEGLPDRALVQLGSDRFRSRAPVQAITYSPDGRWIATVAFEHMAPVRIWNPVTGKELAALSVSDDPGWWAKCIAVSSDGRRLAVGEENGSVSVWSMPDGTLLFREKPHRAFVRAVAFSPDGRHLASEAAGTIMVRPLENLGEAFPLIFEGTRGSIAFSADGRHLVAGIGRNQLKVWNCDGWEPVRTIDPAEYWPGIRFQQYGIHPLPDGKRMLVAGCKVVKRSATALKYGPEDLIRITHLSIWDVTTGELVREFNKSGDTYGQGFAAVSPDGTHVVSRDFYAVNLWDLETGSHIRSTLTPSHQEEAVTFSPDGALIACGSKNAVAFYRVQDLQLLDDDPANSDAPPNSLAWSPDGRRLATGGDGFVRLWDVETGRMLWKRQAAPIVEVYGRTPGISGLCFTPDGGSLIAAGSCDDPDEYGPAVGFVLRLSVDTGGVEWESPLDSSVQRLTLDPDGSLIATSTIDNDKMQVVILDAVRGSVKTTFLRAPELGFRFIQAMRFTPEGESLWISDGDSHVLRYDVQTGRQQEAFSVDWHSEEERRKTPAGRLAQTLTADFFLDAGHVVVSGGKTLFLWDLKDRRMERSFVQTHASGGCIRLSSDGSAIAVTNMAYRRYPDDDVIRLLDLETGETLLELQPRDARAGLLAFSPDGRRLATGFNRGHTIIWDVTRE